MKCSANKEAAYQSMLFTQRYVIVVYHNLKAAFRLPGSRFERVIWRKFILQSDGRTGKDGVGIQVTARPWQRLEGRAAAAGFTVGSRGLAR